MPNLISLTNVQAGLTEAATPKLARMVPVHRWEGNHIWVWVSGPSGSPMLTKLTHKKVKTHKAKLTAPDTANFMMGKIDPYTYKAPADIYPIDWAGDGQPSGTLTNDDSAYKKFTSKGMPDDDQPESTPSLDIEGFEPETVVPDEDGWIEGDYKGTDAILSSDKTHILDADSHEVLWPDKLKPLYPYKIPLNVVPAGKLDAYGHIGYIATDPPDFELSLLPNGQLAHLAGGKYQVFVSDFDGEMIRTSTLVDPGQFTSQDPEPEEVTPAKQADEPVEVLPPKSPEKPPEPEPAPPPADITPDQLKLGEVDDFTGLTAVLNAPALHKAPTGSFYMRTLSQKFFKVVYQKGDAHDVASAWIIDPETPDGLSEMEVSELWGAFKDDAKVSEPEKKDLVPAGFKDLEQKDAYGFPLYKNLNTGKEYSLLPLGIARYYQASGFYRYHIKQYNEYVIDPDKAPVTPEDAGSEVAAAVTDRVTETPIGKLPKGFFAKKKFLTPNQHGTIKIHHTNTDTEEFADWYHLPSGVVAAYDSMMGVYTIAAGAGDVWHLGKLTWTAAEVIAMSKPPKAAAGPDTTTAKKDPHGFKLSVDMEGTEYSNLPMGLMGIWDSGKGTYQLGRLDEGGNFSSSTKDGNDFARVTYIPIRILKRAKPVVGQWRPAGLDQYGGIILARGKSKPGLVRLAPDGFLYKYTSGKYKRCKYTDDGKIKLVANANVAGYLYTKTVRVLAQKVEKEQYFYKGPGSVMEDPWGPQSLSPEEAEALYPTPPHGLPKHWEVSGFADKFGVIPVFKKAGSISAYLMPGGKIIAEYDPSEGGYDPFLSYDGFNWDTDFDTPTILANKVGNAIEPTGGSHFDIPVPGEQVPAATSAAEPTAEPDALSHLLTQIAKPKYGLPPAFKIIGLAKDMGWPGWENATGALQLSKDKQILGDLYALTPDHKTVIWSKTGTAGVAVWHFFVNSGKWELPDQGKTGHVSTLINPVFPAQSSSAPQPAGNEYNAPAQFKIAPWSTLKVPMQVAEMGYEIQPVAFTGTNDPSGKLAELSDKGTIFVTKKGDLIIPQTKYGQITGKYFGWSLDYNKFTPPKLPKAWGIEPKVHPKASKTATPPTAPAKTKQQPPPGAVPVSSFVDDDTPVKQPKLSKPTPKKKKTAAEIENPLITSMLPDEEDLVFAQDGSAMKGAGAKDVYTDKQGTQKYLFKHATQKNTSTQEPHRAYAQEASAAIALSVRDDHIPMKAVKMGSMMGTIQPLVELGDPPDLASYPPSKLTAQEQMDVATDHIIDWLGSQHDSHKSNLMRTAEGRILSIDKEQGFKYFGSDKLDPDYHPNSKYGEDEPYYNKFWKAFGNGEIEFDPQKMKGAIDKAVSMDFANVEPSLRKYAEAIWPGDGYKHEEFIAQVKSRRNTCKRDFEKMITEQYKKREGVEGKFTFRDGWEPTGKVKGEKKQYTTVTHDLAAWATSTSDSTQTVYRDDESSFILKLRQHENDPELLTLKVTHGTGLEAVNDFLDKIGVKPVGAPMQGSANVMVFVSRADLKNVGAFEQEIEVKKIASSAIDPHSGTAEYMPTVEQHASADPNLDLLDNTAKKKLKLTGKRLFLDSDVVEGQTATVRRIKRGGKLFHQVLFKLREEYVSKLTGGIAEDLPTKHGTYNTADDALDQTGGYELMTSYAGSSKVVAHGNDRLHYVPKSASHAIKGLIIAEVESSDIRGSLEELLKKVLPAKHASRVVVEPTENDRRILKAWRLLNAVDPQMHDKLLAAGKLVTDVEAALKKKGVYSQLDSVREVDGLDGYMSHVLPGRWKSVKDTKGEPALRYLFHSTPYADAVPLVLQHGLAGGTERVYQGSTKKGALNSGDFESGGADTIQCRVSTASTAGKPLKIGSVGVSTGYIRFIFAPDVADRIDTIFYTGDTFGCTNPKSSGYGSEYRSRKPFETRLESFQSHPTTSAEVVFPRGIHPRKILRVAVDGENYRDQVLNECYSAKVLEHNGVPIEDFVVVETTQGPVYTKYVKPAGY